MHRSKKSTYQTFTDGWGESWITEDRRLVEKRQAIIHFEEASVGERRFWDAFVAGVSVHRAIRVPLESNVEQGDIFIIQGKQYEVAQKDLKTDRMPASWLLSLQSAEIRYREV